LIGEHIKVALALAPGLSLALADRGQLEQVVMNLVVNARDAMPRGGRLTLETANVTVDESAPAGAAQAPPGAYVTLTVRDTGVGMFPDVQARIFEPFFTTKERGRGTGLGLSTVYGIVQQHRGHVVVESEPGRGTVFTVYLPRVAEPARVVEAPPPVVEPSGATGTILLVEDDSALRIVVREMLSAHGYAVLEARDGDEALSLIGAHGARIGLLLTDVVMPKVGGPEVAGALRRQQPDARVLYMSGYPERTGSPGEITPLLPKPFSPQDLLRRIREVLGIPGVC
jgi:CheY-like chemotaxis protein